MLKVPFNTNNLPFVFDNRSCADDAISYNGRPSTNVGILPADGSTSNTGRILSFAEVIQ